MNRRRNAAERLLASYSRFYGITRFDGMDAPETEGVREALKLSVPLLPGGAEPPPYQLRVNFNDFT